MVYRLICFGWLILTSLSIAAQGVSPVLVIHGGAGTIKREMLSDSMESKIRQQLVMALDSGYAILESGGTAQDAVARAIVILEDSPLFNAGKGAVMNEQGNHELDASIMDGATLDAGAVAGVTRVKNPILSAIAVMERTPHVMLAGEGAEKLAEEVGLEMVENGYFTTPRIKARWEKLKSHSNTRSFSKFGTVGAVALDEKGNIAAGTSTGGVMNKRYNRIGDSPIIGAGTYADNSTCGVSCTGHGEYFIRIGVAKEISDRMEFGHVPLEESARITLEKLGGMNAAGGLIALDSEGNVVMEFNTAGMYRGYKKGKEIKVAIYDQE